ncbi:hypothetical protein F6455_06985 [Proteobacteria bacterium 005FR1]|nr:hypothetical protein [Proteobacteria bacterium 005FR1]
MKWIIYSTGTLLLVGGLMVAGYILMPDKASWAESFTAYSQSLPEEDPLKNQLKPMLADGKLSLWELSQIHCKFETSCALDNFLSSYMNMKSIDMFASMSLEILKAQGQERSHNQMNNEGAGSDI